MVNVGQIGVGYWGPNLLRNFTANALCRVMQVSELAPDRRAYVSKLFPHIDVVDSSETLITNPELDALVIATPAATHYDLAKAALEQGKHVLVEKPLATTVAEVEELARIAKERNLICMVGHTFVFNAAVRFLKQLVDSGALGEIRYVYGQRLNLGRIRSDIDALWNFAPHDISIVQYLFDNQTPSRVVKQGTAFVQPGIDDVVFLTINYPSGVMAHIHVSWLDPNKTRKMVVVGSEKMAIYDDVGENKITIFDKGIDRMAQLGEHMDYDKPPAPTFAYRSGDIHIPKIDFTEPLKTEVQHFLDCITKGVPCVTGPDHALEVVRILESANAV